MYRKTETTINYYYLINEKRAIIKEEFEKTLPLEDYNEYINKYIEKKIKNIYSNNHFKNWFIDRYLLKNKIDLKDIYNKFEIFIKTNGCKYSYPINFINSENKILKLDIKNELNKNTFNELTKNIICIEKSIIQKEKDKMYNRSSIIIVNNLNFENTYELLKEITGEYFEIFNTSEIPINKSLILLTNNDIKIIEKYFNYFNKKYKTNYKLNPENIIYSVLLLRLVFNFCIFCCKEFDSIYHLFIECGMYHEPSLFNNKESRIIFDRNNELFFIKFNNLSSYFNWDLEIRNFIINKNNIISCLNCKKTFFNEDDLIKHLSDEHIEEVARISKYCEDYSLFIKNIDSFIIRDVFGISMNIPKFINDERTKGVKYDLPCVFSGTI